MWSCYNCCTHVITSLSQGFYTTYAAFRCLAIFSIVHHIRYCQRAYACNRLASVEPPWRSGLTAIASAFCCCWRCRACRATIQVNSCSLGASYFCLFSALASWQLLIGLLYSAAGLHHRSLSGCLTGMMHQVHAGSVQLHATNGCLLCDVLHLAYRPAHPCTTEGLHSWLHPLQPEPHKPYGGVAAHCLAWLHWQLL